MILYTQNGVNVMIEPNQIFVEIVDNFENRCFTTEEYFETWVAKLRVKRNIIIVKKYLKNVHVYILKITIY